MNPNNIYIKRDLEAIIRSNLQKKKAIILYGPRQIGKTTLLKKMFADGKTLYLPCDQERIRAGLIPDELQLSQVLGTSKVIILDEAQYLNNPGLIIKILVDTNLSRIIIATGSSSFELANKVNEPLTGRHFQFLLFPLSFSEISTGISSINMQFYLNQAMLYGLYPDVYTSKSIQDKIRKLTTLTDSYLYKDILTFHRVKNSRKVRDLLIMIALQIGSEVSYSELANNLSVDRKTVEYYIDLLEKSFVVFRLYGFSRNARSELNRKVKIYFYDTGIRNSLINNFNELSMRSDGGQLFENFVISEIVKNNANKAQRANYYFWRTYEQKEVDFVSEKNGIITAFEIKLHKDKKTKGLQAFKKSYPLSTTAIITSEIFINKRGTV